MPIRHLSLDDMARYEPKALAAAIDIAKRTLKTGHGLLSRAGADPVMQAKRLMASHNELRKFLDSDEDLSDAA